MMGDVGMDTPITRAEHEEFRKRIEERDNRQDKRLEIFVNAKVKM